MEVDHMVTVSEQHDDECPRCRLRRALEQHLVDAATGTEQQWHDAASSLVSMLAIASSSLTTMRANWTDKRLVDVMEKGAAAAEVLVALLHTLDELQDDLAGPGASLPDNW
jgi:lysine/ornithine N-monooxygenase